VVLSYDLETRIAATVGVSLRTQIKSLPRFWERETVTVRPDRAVKVVHTPAAFASREIGGRCDSLP